MKNKINYTAFVGTGGITKDKQVYVVQNYLGTNKEGQHEYQIAFADGKKKICTYEEVSTKKVTYTFNKRSVSKTKENKLTNKKTQMKLISSDGIKLLSLDIATIKTGYAVFYGDKLIKSGTITKNKTDRFYRIYDMVKAITEIIKKHNINFVVLEDVFLKDVSNASRNVKTLIALANMQGAMINNIIDCKAKFELVLASTWKSHFNILKGRLEGKDSAVDLALSFTGKPMMEDEAEATLIGLYFLRNRVDWRNKWEKKVN